MNTKRLNTLFFRAFSVVIIMAFVFSGFTSVQAARASPFVGEWFAVDADQSEVHLTIGGPPNGPFQITWEQKSVSYCDGGHGIFRGTGNLSEEDPDLLEADLQLECLETGALSDFTFEWRYHPVSDKLSSTWENFVTIWYHTGQFTEPPEFHLRVNYGDDWVESFYEEGHTVWVTVTESDGVTVKAASELTTVPRDDWGGESGFQTMDSTWVDWEGSIMENPPDIKPNDWVYGWVDNGANTKVQIGDIKGTIDLSVDLVQGTVSAAWFTEEIEIECLPWGAPSEMDPQPELKYDTIQPDGEDIYVCSWGGGEWDIQPSEPVGVAYFGFDGNWVANVIRNPRFTVFPEWRALEGYEWPDGVTVSISVEEKDECDMEGISSDGFFFVNYPEDCNIEVGETVIFSDGDTTRSYSVQELAVTEVNGDADTVAGTAEEDAVVYTRVHGVDNSEIPFTADDGTWLADFGSKEIDLVGGTCGRSEIRDEYGNATGVDWCVPNTRFTVFPEWREIEGYEWPDGENVSISVEDKGECAMEGTPSEGFFKVDYPDGCDIEADDKVTLTNTFTTRWHIVKNLEVSGIDIDGDSVYATADEGAVVYAWLNGIEGSEIQMTVEEGTWSADFGANGFDLVEGMSGRVEIRDEAGNATAIEWYIPNPHFTVFPEGKWFDGMDWPDGPVYISVTDKDDCAAKGESSEGFFNGPFPDECDVVADDEVIFTDGETTRTHIVENLVVTNVDLEANMVEGKSSPGAQLYVWVHEQDGSEVQPSADGEGNWVANFANVDFTLVEGMCGRAEIRDGDSNATAVDWCAPETIYVTSLDDTIDNDGYCTLREAVIAANTNSPSGDVEGECPAGVDSQADTIILAEGQTYSLKIDGTNEDGAVDGDLDIWDNSADIDLIIMVDGGGTATISQDASVDDRVLQNYGATMVIQGLTITGGTTDQNGGGLVNYGTLYLNSSQVNGNYAAWGGGINVWGGILIMDDSIVSDNIAENDGGGILAQEGSTVVIQNESLIEENNSAWGGGISCWDSSLTIDDSVIGNNTAENGGGGLLIHDGGIATIQNGSIVSGNSASSGGGIEKWDPSELIIVSSTVTENSTTKYDGGGISNNGVMIINQSMISKNHSSQAGGGISTCCGTVLIDGSTISENTADGDAGGIFIQGEATVTIQNGSFITDNNASWGGGISSWNSSLIIDASTISGNTVSHGGGGLLVHDGGSAIIRNGSVVSGNSSLSGGGIENWGPSETQISSSTISKNSSSGPGGGLWNSGTLNVVDSILSGNTSGSVGDAFYSNTEIADGSVVTNSCIVGNGDMAVLNNLEVLQKFTYNWWGDSSGPSGVGSGAGDWVGDYIEFLYWLIEAPAFCAP
jgi:CSLREA domain-containing protein